MTEHKQSALVVGAVGRLGEAVLNQVLARGHYREVMVQGTGRLSSTLARLRLCESTERPAIDDVYLILASAEDAGYRSYFGRDNRFDALSLLNLTETAQRAAQCGARRAVIIAPMPAWQQVAHAPRGLLNEQEAAIARLSFESLLILRPASQTASSGGSLVQRFAQVYLQLQMLMLPRSIPALTSDQIGRLAVSELQGVRAGLVVRTAADLAVPDAG